MTAPQPVPPTFQPVVVSPASTDAPVKQHVLPPSVGRIDVAIDFKALGRNVVINVPGNVQLSEFLVPPAGALMTGTQPKKAVLAADLKVTLCELRFLGGAELTEANAYLLFEVPAETAIAHGLDLPYIYVSDQVRDADGSTHAWFTLDQLEAFKQAPAAPVTIEPERTVTDVGVEQLDPEKAIEAALDAPADQNYWTESVTPDLVPVDVGAGLDSMPLDVALEVTDETVTFTGDENDLYDAGYGDESEITENPDEARNYFSSQGAATVTTETLRQISYSGMSRMYDPYALYEQKLQGSAVYHDGSQGDWPEPDVTDVLRKRGDFGDYSLDVSVTPPATPIGQFSATVHGYYGTRDYHDMAINQQDPFNAVGEMETLLVLDTPTINHAVHVDPYVQLQMNTIYNRFDFGLVTQASLGHGDFFSASAKLTPGTLWNTQPTYYQFVDVEGQITETQTSDEQYSVGEISTALAGESQTALSSESQYQPLIFDEKPLMSNLDFRYLHYYGNDAYMGAFVNYDSHSLGYAQSPNQHVVAGFNSGLRLGKLESRLGLGTAGFIGGGEFFGVGQLGLGLDLGWFNPAVTGLVIIPITPDLGDRGFQLNADLGFDIVEHIKIDALVNAGKSGIQEGLGLATYADGIQVTGGALLTVALGPAHTSSGVSVENSEVSLGTVTGTDISGTYQDEVIVITDCQAASDIILHPERNAQAWQFGVEGSCHEVRNGGGRPGATGLLFSSTPTGLDDPMGLIESDDTE